MKSKAVNKDFLKRPKTQMKKNNIKKSSRLNNIGYEDICDEGVVNNCSKYVKNVHSNSKNNQENGLQNNNNINKNLESSFKQSDSIIKEISLKFSNQKSLDLKDKFKLNTVIEVDEEYNTGRNKVNCKDMFSRSTTSNLPSNFHIYSKTVIEVQNNNRPSFIKINQKTIFEDEEDEEDKINYVSKNEIHKKYGDHFKSLGSLNNNFKNEKF